MTSRSEHLQWCKDRALAILETGNLQEAFASMCSDITKHPETAHHESTNQLGMMQLITGTLNTKEDMRHWILGYN